MRTHAHSFVGNHKTSCFSFRLIFTSILKQQPQEKPLIAVSPVAVAVKEKLWQARDLATTFAFRTKKYTF